MTATATGIRATAIDAHYYLAKDFGRALAFYRDVIGLTISMEGPNFVEFDLADGNTLGISIIPDGRWFPGGGVMFGVADPQAALARLQEAGVTILTQGLEESPMCFTAWCLDTEGNNFAIHQRR